MNYQYIWYKEQETLLGSVLNANRKQQQWLIGRPQIIKCILLFLVIFATLHVSVATFGTRIQKL